MNKKIMILGGAGYLGWAVGLHLANVNDGEVILVDNLIKQKIVCSDDDDSLIPYQNVREKIIKYEEVFKKNNLSFEQQNINENGVIETLFEVHKPDIVINYAQLPSAPFSLRGVNEACFVTQNNVNGNLRVLFAMKNHCPNAQLIKMSTMGIYGQPGFTIPENKLEVEIDGNKHLINYPYMAGSVYHWSKVSETQHCQYFADLWDLDIIDLAQGIVYGVNTEETSKDPMLATQFYYSGTWGTVINRFVTQALCGIPLTVYGTGKQIRGLINLKDAIKCVELYINNPQKGYKRINQMCEQNYTVMELAKMVKMVGEDLGYKVNIQQIENPRKENEEHYFKADCQKVKDLGLKMHSILDETRQMFKDLEPYKNRIKKEIIMPKIKWV